MRRVLGLALLTVIGFSVTSVLASLQQPAPVAAAPAAAQTPAPSSSKIWVGRHAEFEEFLRTAEIERTTTVSVGVLGIKRAYFKPGGLAASAALRSIRPGKYGGFWESYRSEIAANKHARLLELDMVPPTVERRYNGEMVSLQLWAQDMRMLGEIQKQKLQAPNLEAYNFQLRRLRVFQNLVGNLDPNQGNILFDPVWNVVLIDFSRAFTNVRTLKFEVMYIDRPLFDRIKSLNRDTLRRELGEFVETGAVEALLSRRDDVVKAFEKLAREKGDREVFRP
jgi:hypothetical protein